MSGWIDHWVIAPIGLPLVGAATVLRFDERRRLLKRALGIVTSLAFLAISLLLLQLVNTPAADGGPAKPLVYLLGNWAAPFGIVVIADRLSVLMLVLTSVLGFTAMLYALARWDRSRSEEHTSELQSLMRISYAVFCLKKQKKHQ